MVLTTIQKMIASQLGIGNPAVITPETSLLDDLEADSLDAVEIIMAIEDEFGLEIPDEMAESLRTVGEIVEYVEEHKTA
ncbi:MULTISPECIES: acyl carrier protein [Anoxynatronum]|uniref:Acyl carrier protein n=2 Tax=Anoxynatronum TaxID=210622 RepID=A0AA46AHR2_9CLOT|nr:acyl carrier protein [Anoxynatronum buryatiense]SMP41767.1 acyl carrier protein [Anoxynatronum buryatiense]